MFTNKAIDIDINDFGNDNDDIECIGDFDFFQSDSVPRLAGRWYQSFSRCWSEKDLLRREAVREGETRFQKFQSKANFSDEDTTAPGIDKSILWEWESELFDTYELL